MSERHADQCTVGINENNFKFRLKKIFQTANLKMCTLQILYYYKQNTKPSYFFRLINFVLPYLSPLSFAYEPRRLCRHIGDDRKQ